jgi:hypothetical protein
LDCQWQMMQTLSSLQQQILLSINSPQSALKFLENEEQKNYMLNAE